MAAYNKELRDSTGTNIIYPLTKATNVFMDDNTTVQASMPTVTLNGKKLRQSVFMLLQILVQRDKF